MTRTGPPLGAHTSIAGGVEKSLERGQQIGADAIQIFTKNPAQWKGRPFTEAEVAAFNARRAETGIWPVVAHAIYLINLATADEVLRDKSLETFIGEMERCEQLGLPGLILHPGAPARGERDAGIVQLAASLDEALGRLAGYKVQVWLEVMAGQGGHLGRTFDELQLVMDAMREADRVGFCFDTAHALAAGYELRTPEGYAATFQEFDEALGLGRLHTIHLNDTKKDLGSHVDRHEHIGQGKLGVEMFRMLLNDPRFVEVPMLLETPKGADMAEDVMNLATLRGLLEVPVQ